MQTLINTREDLDAIAGTPEHVAFMATLRGTLWHIERDDSAKCWRAVEDDTTVARFGFTRSDFPDAVPPELPDYVESVLPPISVTPWQIRKAINQLALRESVEKAVAESDDYNLKDAWHYAQTFVEDDPLVIKLCATIGKTDAERHALFALAETL